MNGVENGEAAARTSPRSVLPPWETNGHGELATERSRSGLKFTAMEDGRNLKRHAVSGKKCVENKKTRVLCLNFPEFNERRRENSHGWNADSDLEFAAVEDCRKRKSLAQSILVSRGWQGLAASDRLWSKKCEELWVGKAHLPRAALQRGISKLAAYSISVKDAKRTRILKEDLCSHAWEFRFKTSAPLYWLNLDPSWRGTGPPMRRYFHPDGSQTADPTDRVWGGHECTYSIVTSSIDNDDRKIREHYVRIQRWPGMSVSRKQDWGWELDNHVYCYSSIPDADKEGGTGPLFYEEEILR